MVCGHVLEQEPRHALHAEVGKQQGGTFGEDAGTKGCYAGLLMHKTWPWSEWADCITRG